MGQAIRILQCEWTGFDGDCDGTIAFDAERIVSENYGHFTPRLIKRVIETVDPAELMTKVRAYAKVTAEVLTEAGGAQHTAGPQGRLLAPVVVMGELVVELLREDFGRTELQAEPLIIEFIRRHVVNLSANHDNHYEKRPRLRLWLRWHVFRWCWCRNWRTFGKWCTRDFNGAIAIRTLHSPPGQFLIGCQTSIAMGAMKLKFHSQFPYRFSCIFSHTCRTVSTAVLRVSGPLACTADSIA
jgi:hypothetical protein